MKKKILIAMLCLSACIACASGFSACNLFGNDSDSDEHTHTITHFDAKASTCSKEGNKEYWYCNSCGDYFSDENGENKVTLASLKVEKLPHTEVTDAAVPKTCTTDGKTEGKHCSVCNTVTVAQQTIPAGHLEVIDKAVEATCTTDGKTQGKHCTLCNKVTQAQTVIPAHHTLVTDENGKEPTCTETGLTAGKHCEKCDYKEDGTVIPANGHTEVTDKGKAATCTADGLTDGKHCSVCNTVTEAQTVVKATGHTEVDDPAVAATCKTEGKTEGKHCSVCNTVIVKQEAVAKANHNFMGQTCSVCGIHAPSSGLDYTLSDDGKSYAVTGIGTCTDTKIYIADKYNGLPVTAVADSAFHYCENITEAVIPEGVTAIGEKAFYQCYELKNIDIPSTVKTIGKLAFGSCMKLEKIALPEGLTAIERETFDRCMALTEISLPASVKTIGERAFNVCNALTDVNYGGSSGEFNAIDIESGNERLTGANITYAVQTASNGLKFEYHDYHRDDFTGGGYAVVGIGTCTDSDIVIPDTYMGLPVVSIDGDAFKDCNTIKSVTISDTVAYISSSAFDSSSLESLILGKNVILWTYLFRATSLKSITVDSDNPYYVSVDNVLYSKDMTSVCCYPVGKNNASFTIPSTVTSIGMSAFEYNLHLKNITVPSGVTYIGIRAFRGCENLEDFAWPTALNEIGGGAFEGCKKLTQANLPDGIEKLGMGVFVDCANIASITLPDSLLIIGHQTFYGTAYYNNASNWETVNNSNHVAHKSLYIGKHLLEVWVYDAHQFTIKDGTRTVAVWAFENTEFNHDNVSEEELNHFHIGVVVPNSVVALPAYMFMGYGRFVELNVDTNSKWNPYFDSGLEVSDVYSAETVIREIQETSLRSMLDNGVGMMYYTKVQN